MPFSVITFKPIGVVRRDLDVYNLDVLRTREAIIEVYPEYIDGLKDIESREYLWIIWYAHLVKPLEKDRLLIYPRGDISRGKTGVFNTRSPRRINNIMISLVRLIHRMENKIYVIGLDAFNNSPVLDIKPYVRSLDDPNSIRV